MQKRAIVAVVVDLSADTLLGDLKSEGFGFNVLI